MRTEDVAQNPILVLNLVLSQGESLPEQEEDVILWQQEASLGPLTTRIEIHTFTGKAGVEGLVSFLSFSGKAISVTIYDMRPPRRHTPSLTNIHWSSPMH